MDFNRDEFFMRQAVRLAEEGRGFTSPNPVVGACIVRSGRILSKGFHRRFGAPHAEVEVIKKAWGKTKGTTLYVSMEPCSTYGKTPPCVQTIIDAKIGRVVIGMLDPNPKHSGRGVSILRKQGVRVTTGVLEEQARIQNESFSKWITKGFPFGALKMAESLDGKIALESGQSRWISGPESRKWVHKLRTGHDAVMVGTNTLLRDNPRLTARGGHGNWLPWKIVLDPRGQCRSNMRIFLAGGPVLLACSEKYFNHVTRKFRSTGIVIIPLKAKGDYLNLKQLFKHLGGLGITSVLAEGGGELSWSLISAGLIDKIYWIIAPKLIGGKNSKTSVEGCGVASLDQSYMVKRMNLQRLGSDLLIEGYLK